MTLMNTTATTGKLFIFSALAAVTAMGQELVLADRLRQLQVDKGSFTLVDVRDPGEFKRHHIEGAVSLPKDKIGSDILPKGGRIILYCGDARCPLGHSAAKTLMASGVENVGVLYGGLAQWEKGGFPVTPASVANSKPLGDIAVGELQARLQKPETIVIVDVRPTQDFAAGHLPGAQSIPLEDLADAIGALGRPPEIVVYDRLPQRSKSATRQLAEAGLRARALSGGIGAWAMKGFPLEAGSQKGS